MKSLKRILAVIAATASVFAFAGCSEEDADALLGPENTWCGMDVTYTPENASSSATIYVWCYYTDTEVKGTGTTAGMKSDITLPAGLTFVVTSKVDNSSIISGLTKNAYIMKSFPKDTDTSTDLDASDTTYSFKGSRAAWAALYWAKADLRNSENQLSKNTVLSVLATTSSDENLSWDSVKSTFSWKKLLANYLLN